MYRLFRWIAEKTSYSFAFVPFEAASGYFAASYAFFIVYFSVDRFAPETLEAFGGTLGAMLVLCTGLHAFGFGAFESLGLPPFLALPRAINRDFRRFRTGEDSGDRELEGLLKRLARLPRYHMGAAVVLSALVTVPSVIVEYRFSGSFRHLASGALGGVIAGILFCYFSYVISETLSAPLRSACRREMVRRNISLPQVHGISLRGKIGFTVAIVFFSMAMLVYFLWFCRASLILSAGFLVTTFLTVTVLVSFYFRSVKAAFDEILRSTRSVSRGGADLLHLGNNEKELVEFAEHFNGSVRETIALRRDLETQVNERTLELSRKAGELQRANERLQELDRLKSRFLSSVSHELRTPLTAIVGFAKLVQRDFCRIAGLYSENPEKARTKSERIRTNLDIIQREGDRLTRLINNVLDLARIESGRMEWNDRDLDAAQCVRQAVEVMEGACDRRPEVRLSGEASGPLPVVRADPDRILQVLVNLLGNALKFTRNGEVRLHARPEANGGVCFEVVDTGSGIAPEDAERVFERFHQAGDGATRPSGTGLGLSICREIVEHYGGRIRARPRRGPGSRFVFRLPAPGSSGGDANGPKPWKEKRGERFDENSDRRRRGPHSIPS